MSRTDKTKPFWVKLLHGDLECVEHHDHTDDRCDLPDPEDAVAFIYGTTQCRRVFRYTGIQTCCCDMCHGNGGWDIPSGKRQRLERRKANRDWYLEYETKDPDVDYWIGDNPYWPYRDGRLAREEDL